MQRFQQILGPTPSLPPCTIVVQLLAGHVMWPGSQVETRSVVRSSQRRPSASLSVCVCVYVWKVLFEGPDLHGSGGSLCTLLPHGLMHILWKNFTRPLAEWSLPPSISLVFSFHMCGFSVLCGSPPPFPFIFLLMFLSAWASPGLGFLWLEIGRLTT